MMWCNANQALPNVRNPLHFGWKEDDSGKQLEPLWFEGRAVLEDVESGECEDEDKFEEMETDEEFGGEWSGDSESDDE